MIWAITLVPEQLTFVSRTGGSRPSRPISRSADPNGLYFSFEAIDFIQSTGFFTTGHALAMNDLSSTGGPSRRRVFATGAGGPAWVADVVGIVGASGSEAT